LQYFLLLLVKFNSLMFKDFNTKFRIE
jgi:hypothetical protein